METLWSTEKEIDNYEWDKAHVKQITLLTTPLYLSSKIKAFAIAKEMWDAVKADVSNKSMLQQIDILSSSRRCAAVRMPMSMLTFSLDVTDGSCNLACGKNENDQILIGLIFILFCLA